MIKDCRMCNSPAKSIFLLIILMLFTLEAQSQDANEEELIEWTSTAGQMLYNYHSAFDIAVQTIHQQAGAEEIPKVYAGGPQNGGWAFSFGEIESSGEYILTYGVIIGPNGEVLEFDHFDFRRVASAHHTLAAHSLLKVKKDFEALRSGNDKFEAEVFRYAVLPFPRNQLTAFVSPKQIFTNLTLVGNDVMYTLNRRDSEIIRRTQFIHSLLKFPYEVPENMEMMLLKVPQNPMPSPVDVMIAMERGEKLAVYARLGMYMIEPGGDIRKLADDDPLIKAAQ